MGRAYWIWGHVRHAGAHSRPFSKKCKESQENRLGNSYTESTFVPVAVLSQALTRICMDLPNWGFEFCLVPWPFRNRQKISLPFTNLVLEPRPLLDRALDALENKTLEFIAFWNKLSSVFDNFSADDCDHDCGHDSRLPEIQRSQIMVGPFSLASMVADSLDGLLLWCGR